MEERDRMKILAGAGIINESLKNKNKELEAIEIIDKYDYLQKAFKYIILNNSSNNSPYHNLNHLLTVLKYCSRSSCRKFKRKRVKRTFNFSYIS